jgi:two-component system OmpR family response regulator
MSPRLKVLVIEDDSNVRELIRTRLTLSGYEVQTARNGVEGLNRALCFHPDAMVLDINMPELDGFGVLERLKAKGLRIPVLVLTARHAADDVRRAIGLGAKDYLTKPFTETQLQARVARLLRAAAPAAPTAATPVAV